MKKSSIQTQQIISQGVIKKQSTTYQISAPRTDKDQKKKEKGS